jgi:hypothetical protein
MWSMRNAGVGISADPSGQVKPNPQPARRCALVIRARRSAAMFEVISVQLKSPAYDDGIGSAGYASRQVRKLHAVAANRGRCRPGIQMQAVMATSLSPKRTVTRRPRGSPASTMRSTGRLVNGSLEKIAHPPFSFATPTW